MPVVAQETQGCQVEAPPANGGVSVTEAAVASGVKVGYSCNEGYTPSAGDARRTCLDSGKLSGAPLQCVRQRACPDKWAFLASSGQCYRYFNTKADYAAALLKCQDLLGTLAMPTTAEENAILEQVKPSGSKCWIGLSDRRSNGDFVWADGAPLLGNSWSNWKWGRSTFQGKGCVYVRDASAVWADTKCRRPGLRFICQVPLTAFFGHGDVALSPPNPLCTINFGKRVFQFC